MNKPVTKLEPEAEVASPVDPLALLRRPFPDNQVSKLPKESRKQIDERKAGQNSINNCPVCGGWHHKNAVHLDYVGHAALTDRLLDVDPLWSWEPCGFGPDGLPAFDRNGGLWIKLTVCGVTRLGYGNAEGKQGGDAVKEIIGDALRNAAMRFGAALDLWHKGDLHAHEAEEEASDPPKRPEAKRAEPKLPTLAERADRLEATLKAVKPEEIEKAWGLGAAVLALLSVEMPERLAELTTLYEFRRPEAAPQKEAA